jgi:hypothetical protein
MKKWMVWGSDDMVEFNTEAEAVEFANTALQLYREEAADNGNMTELWGGSHDG